MRSIARKTITATITVAATAAFGLGASSEAWGGKSSAWDRVGTSKSSSWDSSSWDRAGTTTKSSAWDSSAWD